MYLLRWGFEYPNGQKKCGMWSHSGPKEDLHTKAWANKKNMVYAFVEAKNIETKEVKEVVRCKNEQFLNFQWIAVASINPLFLKGEKTPVTSIKGITMLTTKESIDILNTGKAFRGAARNTNINFKVY